MLKMLKKRFLGPKMHFGVKSEKMHFCVFLRFLNSGAFIWAYYSRVSCDLAEASELLQKFCRVASFDFVRKYENMVLHEFMTYVKVMTK